VLVVTLRSHPLVLYITQRTSQDFLFHLTLSCFPSEQQKNCHLIYYRYTYLFFCHLPLKCQFREDRDFISCISSV
jgi:hypothetical protein